MREQKCTNCGSKQLTFHAGVYTCEYCGTTFSGEPDDSIYVRNTTKGVTYEYGECMFDNGAKYEGQFLNGICSGQGTLTYEDGSQWVGIWKNGEEWDGEGTIFFETSTYTGSFRNGKRNGYGKETYVAGGSWEGEWVDDEEWNGEGTNRFYDEDSKLTGQVYIGKIVDGKRDEKGEWHFNGYWKHFEIENDVLVDYYGKDEHVVIPNGVHRVRDRCFRFSDAKSIKCPYSVKIFEGTFEDCKKLKYFEAPGLEEFSTELFSKNKIIEKVVLENIQKIPKDAFNSCTSLRHVVIPNAKTIGSYAFYNSAVVTVDAPLVQEIKRSGFSCCEKLEEINLPSLEIIGEDAFKVCKQLKRMILPNAKTIADSAFSSCERMQILEAPKLERLASWALSTCKSLKKVEFPNLLTIDECAFSGCAELEEVICEKAKLKPNSKGQFNQFIYCPKIETIKTSETINKKSILKDENGKQATGCYVATCVYGSYDCPQVWTLRRYRDTTLASTWYGRVFIHTYYAISPTIVKWFGNTQWFKNMWQGTLDRMVSKLQAQGVEETPYEDKNW